MHNAPACSIHAFMRDNLHPNLRHVPGITASNMHHNGPELSQTCINSLPIILGSISGGYLSGVGTHSHQQRVSHACHTRHPFHMHHLGQCTASHTSHAERDDTKQTHACLDCRAQFAQGHHMPAQLLSPDMYCACIACSNQVCQAPVKAPADQIHPGTASASRPRSLICAHFSLPVMYHALDPSLKIKTLHTAR